MTNPPTQLPTWAQTREAQRLIAEILASEPEFTTVPSAYGFGQREYRYQGDTARKLRKLHNVECDRLLEEWSASRMDRQAVIDATREDADKLIERLLAAAEQLTIREGDPLRKYGEAA